MPKIPTILAEGRIDGTPTAPYADPSGYAAPMGALAQGLTNLGGDMAVIAAKKARDDEDRWLSESAAKFSRTMADFSANPENASKETYAVDFQAFAEKQLDEYTAAAPGEHAANRFRAHALGEIGNRYEHALRVAERTKLNNATLSVERGIGDALAMYRADASTSPEYAAGNLEPLRQMLLGNVQSTFGKLAPEVSTKLKESVDTQFILGSLRDNPAYARELALNSENIDEGRRNQLLDQIDRTEKDNNILGQEVIQEQLNDLLQTALITGDPVVLPGDAIYDVFGEKKAVIKQRTENAAREINTGLSITAKLADKNAGYQQQQLQAIAATTDPESFKIAAQRLHDIQVQQEKDPAGFMAQHNSRVQSAFLAASAPNSDHLRAYAYDVSLRYQGNPPPGATGDEAARYLGLPTGAQHVMTQAEAEGMGLQIMKGQPSQRLQAIEEAVATFPAKHQDHAFNDLVTWGKVPQSTQLAFLNRDKPDVNALIGAILNSDVKLTEESKGKYEAELLVNDTWTDFAQTMIGDDFQRGKEIEGYKDAVLAYAYTTRRNPREAVGLSVGKWIGSNFGFARANGQKVAVIRERPGKSPRDDREIAQYGRGMELALKQLDASRVNTRDIYGRSLFPTSEIAADKSGHIKGIITSRGFFKVEAGGQSVTLYVLGDDGESFQLTDKNGKPFQWGFDSLPVDSKGSILDLNFRP